MKTFWKKVMAVSLSAALAFATLGCGGTKQAATSSSESGDAGKIIIGQASWIGFAPFYIAADKGYFKDHGVDVEIQSIESKADSKSALAAGRIQGVSTTIDTQIVNASSGIDLSCVLVLDTSSGGDGIVAKKEYNSIEELKGKKVALDTTGGADFFWFQYLLHQKGMTLKDFDVQNMAAGDAGAAFVAGKVDAAITWQPWLSKASKTDFGHTLIDSKASPGVIVDTFAMRKDFIKAHPDAVKGITAAWYDAIKFLKENPEEAVEILAKHLGEKPENVKSELKDVTFYDEQGNKTYFGTKENPGDFYKVAKMASDLWVELKLIDKPVVPEDVLDSSYL